MNIRDIIPKKGIYNRKSVVRSRDQNYDDAGYYSTVHHSKNPFEVIKKTISRDVNQFSEDGYPAYVRAIIEYTKAKGENPYFPKFFRVVSAKNANGKYPGHELMNIRMERLQHLSQLSEEDAYEMYTRMFSGPVSDAKVGILTKLRGLIDGDIDPSIIVDFRLEEAIELIKRVQKENSSFPDIGLGNIMFRWTPQGPHLVITDPLS
jgi:hypothetical protein